MAVIPPSRKIARSCESNFTCTQYRLTRSWLVAESSCSASNLVVARANYVCRRDTSPHLASLQLTRRVYIFIKYEYMAARNAALSNFELMVLLVLSRLGDEAYGVP